MTTRAWNEFPPHVLREYALLADGQRGALCGPRGDLVWMCVPRWDSDAILSSLVGGEGVYAVTPASPFVWGGSYEPGSLIWRNRWVTADDIVECRDALAYPGDPHLTTVLRRVEALEGTARIDVVLDLRAGFGREPMRDVRRDEGGTWTLRTGDQWVRWSGAGAAELVDGQLRLRIEISAGSHHDLALEISDRMLARPCEVDRAWDATAQAWQDAVPHFDDSVAPRDARHAYAVLRGLTSPGGGMVASPTLGLPERAESGRNFDYRYVWLRDQTYAGLAASVTSALPLLDDAVAFATARLLEHGADLLPAYRIDGAPLPREHTLSLPGYPGGSDVVGNWVLDQFQLDTMGELLQLFASAAHHDHLGADTERAIDVAIAGIETKWDEPDAGIWELDDDWWTHSRLACVAGLHAISGHVPRDRVQTVLGLADRILTETTRRCLDEDGAWLRRPGHDGSDASLVLPPVRGALPADDVRTRATLRRVGRDLTQEHFAYRFQPDERPLGRAEGAFVLCGFSLALAHWHQGNEVEAFRWFERNRAACGPSGLLSEEYDVRQRQMRGNLPQGFVHAALLESAVRLATDPGRQPG